MASKKEKASMRDFLVDKLKSHHSLVEPKTSHLIGDSEDVNYIEVDNAVVFLIDRPYRGRKFQRTIEDLNRIKEERLSFVFYKDGRNFFRSAARQNHFKRNDLSLKNYTSEEVNQMIKTRPEEMFLWSSRRPWLQYYQPNSSELEEGLRSFKFGRVNYDYSHIPSSEFVSSDKDSDKLLIWTEDRFFNSGLKVSGGYLTQQKQ